MKLDSATAFGVSLAFPSGREAIAVGHDIDMNDITVTPEELL